MVLLARERLLMEEYPSSLNISDDCFVKFFVKTKVFCPCSSFHVLILLTHCRDCEVVYTASRK